MRIFKKYSPALIVKHVRTFFKGRLYISGKGAYEFDNGIMLMPVDADIKHKATVNEINRAIELSKHN
jgi:hypothetical protein